MNCKERDIELFLEYKPFGLEALKLHLPDHLVGEMNILDSISVFEWRLKGVHVGTIQKHFLTNVKMTFIRFKRNSKKD